MNIALVDLTDHRVNLFPLTITRPIGSLRVGILTIREKWNHYLDQTTDLLSIPMLNNKFQQGPSPYELIINANICPDEAMTKVVLSLDDGQVLMGKKGLIAARGNFVDTDDLEILDDLNRREYEGDYVTINRTWDIFLQNGEQIKKDYALLTKGRKSAPITDKYTVVYGEENIFVEEGAKIRAAYLNAEAGPIYISKNSEIQEGSAILGPFFLGEGSRINLNSKIREATSIGPGCKIGGEVSNSVVYANSNKAHGGYLGNSVIGEFCNLGAATNNSNLKNNYETVKMWDYQLETYRDTGLNFCGMVMGDHSKSAIGTTFNTGTTVGVSCNVFGSGFPPKYLASYSWGGAGRIVNYDIEKALSTAEKVFMRKEGVVRKEDLDILREVYNSQVNIDV